MREQSAHRAAPPAQLPISSRIMLVEDHPIMRYGLRTILSQDSHITVAGECATAREALETLRTCAPSMVIMDITLPGGLDGIELIKCMLSEAPRIAILVFSVHDEALYALRAIAAGAKGYIMKERPLQELLEAVHTVARGEISVSLPITQRLVKKAAGAPPETSLLKTQRLSDRELEVLFQIGKGQSTFEIASGLHISVKTVETHRANLRRKLALRGGPELLRYAVAWRFAEGHHASDPIPSSPPPRISDAPQPFPTWI